MIQAVEESVADDLMIKQVKTIAPTSTVVDAARMMFGNSLRYLIVIDDDRHVVGVVTQSDILQYVIEPLDDQERQGQDWHDHWETEVRNLITQELITIKADLPIYEVAWTLAINRIGCLPVVDEEECLIGMVSLPDVVKHMTTDMPSRSDKGFQFYVPPDKEERPNLPAFFRRVCGTLVIPVKSLEDVDLERKYTRLGYDSSNGRIVVRLVDEQGPGDQQVSKETINRDGLYLVIPAREFVEAFNINSRVKAYDITCYAGDIFLTPRQ